MVRYASEEEITRQNYDRQDAYVKIAKCLPRITKALEAIADSIPSGPTKKENESKSK